MQRQRKKPGTPADSEAAGSAARGAPASEGDRKGRPAGGKHARERILEAAEALFYRDGIRAVGVDAVVAKSGVAKMSLYRSFASKDELIAAFLSALDARYWARWDALMSRHSGAPREQLRALFGDVAARVSKPDYRGCPFLNAATELPEPAHPGRAVALANKRALRTRLAALASGVGARDPALLADQLLLLLEGAYSMGNTLGREGPPRALSAAAEALIEAQLGPRRR